MESAFTIAWNTHLPESLKRFYQASDGMTLIAFDARSNELWSVEKISRFPDNEPELVAASSKNDGCEGCGDELAFSA